MRYIISVLISTILFTTIAHSGSFKSSYGYNSRSHVIASVEIIDKGIYNLVVSVNFSNRPRTTKAYKKDIYEPLIERLQVEWPGIAMKIILKSNSYKVSDFSALENEISLAIDDLIKSTKAIYDVSEDTEVIYSISSFYLGAIDS